MQGYFKDKGYGEFDNKRSARRLEAAPATESSGSGS
jgi:hypothetical protein